MGFTDHWKIRFLSWVTKNQYRVRDCQKRGAWAVCIFKGRIEKKEGCGVFDVGGGGGGLILDTPMHIMLPLTCQLLSCSYHIFLRSVYFSRNAAFFKIYAKSLENRIVFTINRSITIKINERQDVCTNILYRILKKDDCLSTRKKRKYKNIKQVTLRMIYIVMFCPIWYSWYNLACNFSLQRYYK